MIAARRRPLLLIVATAIAVEVSMILTGMGPDVVLVATAVTIIGVGAWIIVDTAGAIPTESPLGTAARQEPQHRVDRRVTRLRSGLAHGQTDQLSAERLHTGLVAIIDDQLRARYRVDRRADPSAAEAVIGPDLARFVDDPHARIALPSARDLDRILTQIERL